MPKLELTYFDSAGRAEPIRVALRIAGVDFVDHRLTYTEFVAAKEGEQLPLGQVPVLTVDGQRIVQTSAMLRYVARIGDESLYPSDPAAALIVDSAIDSLNDTLSHALSPSLRERDPAKKLAMRADLAKGAMAQVFVYLEQLVARSGGPFVTGKAMSIADLVVASQINQIRDGRLDGLDTSHLAPYPRLVALADAYLAEPRISALRPA